MLHINNPTLITFSCVSAKIMNSAGILLLIFAIVILQETAHL